MAMTTDAVAATDETALGTDAIKVGLAALAFPAAWKLARRD